MALSEHCCWFCQWLQQQQQPASLGLHTRRYGEGGGCIRRGGAANARHGALHGSYDARVKGHASRMRKRTGASFSVERQPEPTQKPGLPAAPAPLGATAVRPGQRKATSVQATCALDAALSETREVFKNLRCVRACGDNIILPTAVESRGRAHARHPHRAHFEGEDEQGDSEGEGEGEAEDGLG